MNDAQISVRVVKKSVSPTGEIISSIITESPLSYHAQNLTHRVMSRNSSSGRAEPTEVLCGRVARNPVRPLKYLQNRRGMQGFEELDPRVAKECKKIWDKHRENTLSAVETLASYGLHKQYANRLLAPHQTIKVLWTTTGWKNFFHLRNHQDAQPEEQLLARMIEEALDDAIAEPLEYGQWHLPFIQDYHYDEIIRFLKKGRITRDEPRAEEILEVAKKVSASCCATLSYNKNPDGSHWTVEKAMERVGLLMSDPLHASPFEHQATPDRKIMVEREQLLDDQGSTKYLGVREEWEHPELHGNLTGFIQYRKTLPNESVPG